MCNSSNKLSREITQKFTEKIIQKFTLKCKNLSTLHQIVHYSVQTCVNHTDSGVSSVQIIKKNIESLWRLI